MMQFYKGRLHKKGQGRNFAAGHCKYDFITISCVNFYDGNELLHSNGHITPFLFGISSLAKDRGGDCPFAPVWLASLSLVHD